MASFGLGRRKFFLASGAATLGLTLASLATRKRANARNLGDLVPDPAGVLDLPPGFSYQILDQFEDDMDDGYRVPARPDGMACFAGPDNTLILMRNHENSFGDQNGPYTGDQTPPPEAYVAQANGGVTRMVVDATTFERISSNLVLIGTRRNCSGGPSPWGWLSCEEDVTNSSNGRHGYVFLCSIDATSVQAPNRIDGYGRYNHEAAAIDPSNYHAYLTEDQLDSCLYRFVPDDMADPFVGKLQALKVVGIDNFATGGMADGEVVDIEWVDIDEPDPETDTVRDEAQAKGGALFIRAEGICFFEGQIYICTTAGGPVYAGQIFRLIDGATPTLELVVQSHALPELEAPDNIVVAPWGEVFLCEDGNGDNYIRWVTAEGQICTFAHNAASDSEFAGVCFSPDGKAMFVNLQADGITLVITGPFPSDAPGDGDGDTTDTTESTDTDAGESEGDSAGGSSEGDATGTGDEIADESGTGDETGAAIGDEAEGCSCSTSGEQTSVGALVTGLAAMALGSLVRERDHE
ncbi:alkaline phosphatase PhoX [Nannocystaceae bacterium ST9]